MAVCAKVRIIPQDFRALPLALFTKPSKINPFMTFYEIIKFRGKRI
jgi:hypothetical protein